ncbi:hypothetical protein GCM10020366_47620 [Saccharopolyspora gregorii]|uniref:Uncharacterized protein n=1 Tax=Saccharopolyspora gregorii TaxID=33914 RepID=A0ABP6RWG7_9PSEU
MEPDPLAALRIRCRAGMGRSPPPATAGDVNRSVISSGPWPVSAIRANEIRAAAAPGRQADTDVPPRNVAVASSARDW